MARHVLASVILLFATNAHARATQPGALQGVVTASETGLPVPNVRVEIIDEGHADVHRHAWTDGLGSFRLELPAGHYTLSTNSPHHMPLLLEGVGVHDELTTLRQLVLSLSLPPLPPPPPVL